MAFALADRIVLHVGMRDGFVRCGGIGIERDHSIVAWMAADQIAPIEADFKGPKANALKVNRLGGHRNRIAT
ncbi:MAG: hypothetical protein DWQ31_19610 [Planctomycetota bacterium]|nr:MAG: hypothetical protein DWQ31_19610 [Planctomycetota bacterium]REJ88747.1 MAG: hypothetical protein DWQ35_19280 [Planctomycetota bacterium]REK26588.1 MAG: hypothetical protein DWQ42_08675 [Planctomycetota bacterium]REK46089.1 MAG: hypothetical protein DWQ46_07200 [Planctomycetota bacterium]